MSDAKINPSFSEGAAHLVQALFAGMEFFQERVLSTLALETDVREKARREFLLLLVFATDLGLVFHFGAVDHPRRSEFLGMVTSLPVVAETLGLSELGLPEVKARLDRYAGTIAGIPARDVVRVLSSEYLRAVGERDPLLMAGVAMVLGTHLKLVAQPAESFHRARGVFGRLRQWVREKF
jgi:hypothetical protein